MRRNTVWGLCIVAGLAILIGLGPIVVARVIRKVTMARKEEAGEARKGIRRPILLEVSGKIALMEDVNTQATWLILVADSGKRYILVGAKIEELKNRLGERVKVMGKIKRPQPKEINGQPIRFIIDVTKVESE